MLIREVMHLNPISITPDTSLSETYYLMTENNVRHLPVTKNGVLVGIVSDRDVRLATSKFAKKSLDPETHISEIMSQNVQTTRPSEPIEVATQTMRQFKIGCLPVLDDAKLVGIVTVADLLDAMLLMTGVHYPSGRLDVRLKDRAGELAKLTNIIAQRNVNIHSILSYPEENGKLRVVLRVATMEIRPLAKEICNADFEVLWPLQISCVE
jgi:acetoin utilization protein AcuB